MSRVILSPFACHSEAEPKNLKGCSGQAPAKNVWTSEILHGARPETLRFAQSDSRRIQDNKSRSCHSERREESRFLLGIGSQVSRWPTTCVPDNLDKSLETWEKYHTR